jgi:hypothetical protein
VDGSLKDRELMAGCEVLERDGGDPDKEGAQDRPETEYE